MDNLLQLEKLKRKLAEVVGITELEDGEDEKKIEKQYADAIRMVYHSSQNYILNLAAKLVKGGSFDGEIPKKPREVPLPEDGERDFELGDWIEVAVSHADFKTIQKATLGWNTKLNMVHGHVGIVTGMRSRYDNRIELFFPEVFSGCSLHAGILRKVDRKKHENYNTRWRPGEFVEIVSEPRLAALLQRGLGNIPAQYLGGRGRIISISPRSVEVTVDEIACFHVNPAALLPSKDKTPIGQQRIEHARGFEIGDKVKMITNIKKLIQNQKEKGNWRSEMTMLRGKEVTITSVLPDGTLHVQLPRSRVWRVSPDSVLKLNEDDPLFQDELGFVPDDIVKIKRSNDLRMILTTEKIPLSFLEFLRCPAKIGTIDDDFDCYLLFDAEQHIEVSPSALRKTTKEEARKYWEIQERVKNLKVGEQVHLDVGPPNYVRAIVNKHAVEPDIKMALTKSAKIIGFIDEHSAVIEYESRQRFKIKKKYLTVPDKFHIADSKEGVDLKTVREIQEVISKCLANLHIEKQLANDGWTVDVLTMSYGSPPVVELKVLSLMVKPEDVYRWLHQNSGWDIQYLTEGQLLIEGVRGYHGEIKIGVYFNDDDVGIVPPTSGIGAITERFDEAGDIKGKAEPIQPQGVDRRQVQVEEQGPDVNSFEQFRYLRFSDAALAQDVYFPYILHGPRRTPVQPMAQDDQRQSGRVIYNIPNVDQLNN